MKIVVDIPDYDPNKGIQLKRNAESKLTVIHCCPLKIAKRSLK